MELTREMLVADDLASVQRIVGDAKWPQIEEMISAIRSPVEHATISAPTHVVYYSATKILRWLIEEKNMPMADVEVEAALPGSCDSTKIREILKLLLENGARVKDSRQCSARLYNIACLEDSLAAEGRDKAYNLSVYAHANKRIDTPSIIPLLQQLGWDISVPGNISGLPLMLRAMDHFVRYDEEHRREQRPFLKLDAYHWSVIDAGGVLSDEYLEKFRKCDHSKAWHYLPVRQPLGENPCDISSVDISRIPGFLEQLPPEKLVARCAAFDLLDEKVCQAILDTENHKRNISGEAPMTLQHLLKRLPKPLQAHERLVPLRQMEAKWLAATSEAFDTLRDAAKTSGRRGQVPE